MVANIVKWGNSQGVVLPKAVMELCGFKVNEQVDMEIVNQEIVIRKPFRHKTLEERASEFGGRLGDFAEVDWGRPAEGEVW